jgi:DNA polymerase-3 subunit epsilon
VVEDLRRAKGQQGGLWRLLLCSPDEIGTFSGSPDMPHRWTAIDFETASRERASACALGLAVIENGAIVERRDWLIQPPGNYFEPINTRIHGIHADLVAQEPEFDEVWPEIEPYLRDAVVLAHNAPFDVGVLRASLARYELPVPSTAGWVCTVTMSRRVWPDLADHRLSSVCRHCGIALDHHVAASDAAACASIALHCQRETGAEDLDTLARGLSLRPARL